MKKIISLFILINLLSQLQAQNVGIGNTSSRQSDINSTEKLGKPISVKPIMAKRARQPCFKSVS